MADRKKDRAGEQIGSYHLTRLLGEGGFGDVYEATHPRWGQVALKLLKRELDEQGLREFLSDVRAVLLRHPHIIEILDFGVEGQTPYLAMPYCAAGSLRGRPPRGDRLPLSTIVAYTKQIAEALQYAHDHGAIHRDVKPDNVLVRSDGTLALADFGIAIIFDAGKTHQTVEGFIGSPEYAAPEQFLNKPGPASDQYALGTMVYEWLSGDVPFHASSWTAMGMRKNQEAPPRLAGIPPLVEQVVLTALEKDPGARFASVRAFAEALSQTRQQLTSPVPVAPQSPLPTPLRAAGPPDFPSLASTALQARIPPQPPADSFNQPTASDHTGWSTSTSAPMYQQPRRVTGPVPSRPTPSQSSPHPLSGVPSPGWPLPLPPQPAGKKSRSGVSRALRLLGVLLVCMFLLAWVSLGLLTPNSSQLSPDNSLLSPAAVIFLGPLIVSCICLLVSTLRATTTRTSPSNSVGVIAGLIGALLLVVLIRASLDTVPNALRGGAATLQLVAWIGLAGTCLGILGALLP